MITFKCLYKLIKEEVQGIVFDIKMVNLILFRAGRIIMLQMQILLSIIIPFNKLIKTQENLV